MRHLIDPLDFSKEEVLNLLDLADDIASDRFRYGEVCRGKKLATLFYEPSTRTRLSFEAAMLNLGGSVLGFSSAEQLCFQGRERCGHHPGNFRLRGYLRHASSQRGCSAGRFPFFQNPGY